MYHLYHDKQYSAPASHPAQAITPSTQWLAQGYHRVATTSASIRAWCGRHQHHPMRWWTAVTPQGSWAGGRHPPPPAVQQARRLSLRRHGAVGRRSRPPLRDAGKWDGISLLSAQDLSDDRPGFVAMRAAG